MLQFNQHYLPLVKKFYKIMFRVVFMNCYVQLHKLEFIKFLIEMPKDDYSKKF